MDVLGTKFQRRRADVEQVSTIHRILQALEATKALPDTLQVALQGDDDQVAAAVGQYASLAPVLQACAHKVVLILCMCVWQTSGFCACVVKCVC